MRIRADAPRFALQTVGPMRTTFPDPGACGAPPLTQGALLQTGVPGSGTCMKTDGPAHAGLFFFHVDGRHPLGTDPGSVRART